MADIRFTENIRPKLWDTDFRLGARSRAGILQAAGKKEVTAPRSSPVMQALQQYAEFRLFARQTFHKRFRRYPRITESERMMVLRTLNHLGLDIVKNAWKNNLAGLDPDLTIRPFSEAIGNLDGRRQKHKACVDPRAHIPAEHYAVWNWAFYALSKQGEKECWLSKRVTARWTCQSSSAAYRSLRWLKKHGWIEETEKAIPGRKGKGAKYKILSHPEWVEMRGNGYSPEPGETCVMANDPDADIGSPVN